MYKCTAKSIARKRMGPKQNTKKHWGTIYCNTTLTRPILKRHMGVKSAKANTGKRSLNCSIVNAIKDNNPKALKRLNKSRKHNSNTFKNRNNKTKRLALLGRCPNR